MYCHKTAEKGDHMKKQLLAAGVAATIGLAGTGVGVAHAATNSPDGTGPMSGLVEALSSKFNLDKTEVQQVFDEQHQKMHEERQAQQDEKLAELVTEGKLTSEQVEAIKAKRSELMAAREANRSSMAELSRDDRKANMEEARSELEAWAEEHDIDTEYLRFVMGGHGRGHGGPMGEKPVE